MSVDETPSVAAVAASENNPSYLYGISVDRRAVTYSGRIFAIGQTVDTAPTAQAALTAAITARSAAFALREALLQRLHISQLNADPTASRDYLEFFAAKRRADALTTLAVLQQQEAMGARLPLGIRGDAFIVREAADCELPTLTAGLIAGAVGFNAVALELRALALAIAGAVYLGIEPQHAHFDTGAWDVRGLPWFYIDSPQGSQQVSPQWIPHDMSALIQAVREMCGKGGGQRWFAAPRPGWVFPALVAAYTPTEVLVANLSAMHADSWSRFTALIQDRTVTALAGVCAATTNLDDRPCLRLWHCTDATSGTSVLFDVNTLSSEHCPLPPPIEALRYFTHRDRSRL